jgi:hypothetical protein
MRTTEQIQAAAEAALRFSVGGFQLTPPSIMAERLAFCRLCDEWDGSGFGGTGRCRMCGCSTQAKLRMATECCPLGKWESLTAGNK